MNGALYWMVRIAGVAQSVEQLICNQQVAGSSPIASSSKISQCMEGFPSGQREQTVNLPAKPTEVRTLPPPPSLYSGGRLPSGIEDGRSFYNISGSSSVARASAFQAEGRGFESRFPLQFVWQEALPFLHGSATGSAKT
jgi:hypothetical protein